MTFANARSEVSSAKPERAGSGSTTWGLRSIDTLPKHQIPSPRPATPARGPSWVSLVSWQWQAWWRPAGASVRIRKVCSRDCSGLNALD